MEQPTLNLQIVRAVKNLSPGTMAEILKFEGEEPYFQALDEDDVYLVSNDAPRDGPYTAELVEKTLGFAIVDSMGRVHRKFKDLKLADKALSGATINFDVAVDIEDDDQETTNG